MTTKRTDKRVKWHKGPPPAIGWWPASITQDMHCLRWWDGKAWSRVAYSHETKAVAKRSASIKSIYEPHEIEWADRWWEKK
jgi:hypothetical protein